MKASLLSRRILLPLFIIIVTAAFSLTLFLFLQKPRLLSLEPKMARAGEIIVVEGRFLGAPSPRNSLMVGDQRITSSYILEWEQDRVSFRLPEGLRSGDLRVILPQGESNPLQLTNTDTIPILISGNTDQGYDLRLVEQSDASYWEVTFVGYSPRQILDARWYFDGRRIPAEYLSPSGETVGLYIPVTSLTEDWSGDYDAAELKDSLEDRLDILFDADPDAGYDALGYQRSNRSRRTTIYGGNVPSGEYPLFIWEISLPAPESGGDPEAMVLTVPLPELTDAQLRMDVSLIGAVSLLPESPRFAPGRLFLRYLPRERIFGGDYGSVYLVYYGEPPEPRDIGAALAQADDTYDSAETLLPVFSAYLEPGEAFVLDGEQRDELRRTLAGVRGALPIARTMYDWLAAGEMSGPRRIAAFVDELRRLGIGARSRRGLFFDESGRLAATGWAEVFLPRWGWVPAYRESMENGLGLGESGSTYIPLPVGAEFPLLSDDRDAVLPLGIRLIQPGAGE
jgi:hypothetical protein